ncbi:arrestin domain-containing protein F-like [Condylostylus longicornis]|uniref:arrestin domain-containing protein F-like n=1 Tax=Condylostylus longicornis TaxID=2530218 RepID=UPI00244E22CC|nr:arrestin domain-containing protein F-like [Condylostylus longicornis]
MNGFDDEHLDRHIDATLDLGGKLYRLAKGCYLIGKNSVDFVTKDESLDGKHALINIIDSRHQIIDLQSKRGTYVDNEKIDRCYLINNKVSTIRFGNLNAKYTVLNQSDSGFMDNKSTTPDKDNFDMVAGSPQQNRYLKTRINNQRFGSTSTSTPNHDIKLSESKILKNKDSSRSSNVSNSTVNHSFFVPETQHFDETRQQSRNNIFDSEIAENVKQFINDRSLDDEYYIPETQEIFLLSKKEKTNEILNISTQDFGENDVISNNDFSQNLCPLLRNTRKNSSTFSEDVTKVVNGLKINRNSNDNENTLQVEWNETQFDNRSGATTPDIDFEGVSEEKQPNNNILVDQSNKTSLCNENSDNSSQRIHTEKQQIKNTQLSNSSRKEVFNDFMDDDDLLVPTQPFVLNNIKNLSSKNYVSPKFDEKFDLMEDTAVFKHPGFNEKIFNNSSIRKVAVMSKENNLIKLDKNKDNVLNKENTNINEINTKVQVSNIDEEDEEIACTQVFIPPNKQNQYTGIVKKQSVIPPLNLDKNEDLESTQAFVHPSLQKSSLPSSTLSSNLSENTTNKKRKGNLNSKIEQPIQKKKFPAIVSISTENFKARDKDSPVRPVTNEDADFMMDICTPAIDLIKFAPKENGYIKVMEKIKKPINRIFGEETEDEDDEPLICLKENKVKEKEVNGLRMDIGKEEENEDETESDETPEFLRPIISVEEIKKLGISNFVSKNKKKFIMEETDTSYSAFTDFEDDRKVKTNEKEKCFLKKKSKKLNNNKQKPESTKPKETSQKRGEKKSVKLNVEMTNVKNNKRVKKTGTSSDENIMTSSSSKAKRKTSSKSESINDGDSEWESRCFTSSEAGSTLTTRSTKSNASSRALRKRKTTLTFTKVNEDEYVETVRNIGYAIVSNPEEASIIITNNDISRTSKFLIGLAKGIPIISVDWLKAIQEKNFSYVHYDNYYVKDKKTEKKYNFILRQTLNLVSTASQKLFNGYNFIITKNTNPPKSEMEKIIRCAGGTIINQTKASKLIYAVSDKKDSSLWPTLRSNYDNLIIIKTEGVLLSIMQHRNRLDDHKF